MKPLDIYHQYPIELTEGKFSKVVDSAGKVYTDFYGGHGVISIGHSHPNFVNAINDQLNKLAFYSNAFVNALQFELADLLGKASGYEHFDLFLSNSGAEANENALKVASFFTGRKKVLAIKGAFHGRSAGAVAITNDKSIQPTYGSECEVDFIEMNDKAALETCLLTNNYAALFIEGIQGVAGIFEGTSEFWNAARQLCTQTGTVLVADEVQSGYGRTGKFFAHQHHGVVADVVTVGKGMGNGFPVAGTIISADLKLEKGKLGTTFGGGQLACAAAISVLKTIEAEKQIKNAEQVGNYIKEELQKLDGVKALRGRGLLLGVEFDMDAKVVRQKLINDYGFITGFSKTYILRILPPLNVSMDDAKVFVASVKEILKN